MVVKGLTFYAPLTWLEEPTEKDIETLQLCLKATRHIGLRRNRGRGHVKMSLKHIARTNNGSFARPQAGPDDKYLFYSFTLQAPLISSTLGSDPNSAETLGYVPGSMLRGVLAQRLIEKGYTAATPEFKRYILSNSICYLNACPQVEGNERALPIRRTWLKEKHAQTKRFYDLAVQWPDEQLGLLEYAFSNPTGTDVAGVTPKTSLRVHHQRDYTRGRATTNGGAIFAYESIDPGQTFMGAIRIAANQTEVQKIAELFNELLSKPVTFGRSRRAAYGGMVKVNLERFETLEIRESHTSDIENERIFQIILASDYIGRSPVTGQIDPLGIEEELKVLGNFEVVERFLGYTIIGGYNRTWGTELPQTKALKAGSVLVLKAKETITKERLLQLDRGLGERRNEGFGRVWVDVDLIAERKIEKDGNTNGTSSLVSDDPDVITKMQKQLWQHDLTQQIELKVTELVEGVTLKASASLLGRLRESLRGEMSELKTTLESFTYRDNQGQTKDKKAAKVIRDTVFQVNDLDSENSLNLFTLLEGLCSDQALDYADHILQFTAFVGGESDLLNSSDYISRFKGVLGNAIPEQLASKLIAALMRKAKGDKRD